MKKYQKILFFTLVGFIAFPTITLGSTFVSGLIQGKSVPEAIQILAEQVDLLIGRVGKVETRQSEQEKVIGGQQNVIEQQQEFIKQLQKGEECSKMEMLSKRVVAGRERKIWEAVEYYNQYPPTAEGVLEETRIQYNLYLNVKEKCEE